MDKEECIKETKAHIAEVAKLLQKIATQLLHRARMHDDTKLKEPELPLFMEYTPKLKEQVFGSDEYNESLKGLKVALDHHYNEYPHHPEHFGEAGIKGMSLVDLIEMICDWKASSMRTKDGDIVKSINGYSQKRFKFSDELKQIFLNTVQRELMEDGVCSSCKGDGKPHDTVHDVDKIYQEEEDE